MADVKISALPAAASVTADDLIPIVNDPAGTPATQKATAAQLLAYLLSAPIPVASGGTGAATAALARASLNVDGRTTFSNANYSGLATDKLIAQVGTLSALRTVTLPLASAVNPGYILWIIDESGTVTNTNTIVIARSGADTINGSVASFTMIQSRGRVRAISDGVSAWSINDAQTGLKEYVSTETDALPNATFVQWEVWGAAGGAGSGRRGLTTTSRGGGGGGGGGGYTKTPVFLISDLGGPGTSVTNTIGAGGTAGAAVSADNTDGNAGGAGGATNVAITNKLQAIVGAGTGGAAGTTSGGAAGITGGNSMFIGAAGGAGGVGAAGSNGVHSTNGGGGGGGGGGLDTLDTNRAGGTGAPGTFALGNGNGPFTAGGTAGGGNGANSTSASAMAPLPVSSGSGGGSNNAGTGGTGGTGGRGCGGGGGGASQNGANSGAGGPGGAGYIRRMTW